MAAELTVMSINLGQLNNGAGVGSNTLTTNNAPTNKHVMMMVTIAGYICIYFLSLFNCKFTGCVDLALQYRK
ncbi:hypothetical protein PAUR_a2815 [Pseudoalteromonas aurantia 208]|uniref:Uncharacterized protein n=1 Tax=Pseudoalteromonas aurantia 208 TaxID=1314867 RepID=A0ABR9EDI4_9GAMM|nr:hypothetical protein [Pseudoalteromonas aurantia 208]